MNTSDEMRRLFDEVLTSPPPDRTDIDAAVHAGRWRRRRRPAAVLVSLSAVLVAAGVVVASVWSTTAPQPPTAVARPPAADGGSTVASTSDLLGVWRAVQLDGQDVSDAAGVTGQVIVRFGDDQGGPWWGATDGCNETTGRFTLTSAGRFSATAVVTTAVGCLITGYPGNPAAVLAADEARIIEAIGAEPRRLVLSTGGQVIAVYADESDVSAP